MQLNDTVQYSVEDPDKVVILARDSHCLDGSDGLCVMNLDACVSL